MNKLCSEKAVVAAVDDNVVVVVFAAVVFLVDPVVFAHLHFVLLSAQYPARNEL